MSKALYVIFWILTDLFLVLGIVLFPSFFSVFAVLAAAIFAPIEEWQNLINKHIKKPVKSAIIAICVAFVIALFPFTEVIVGFNRLYSEAKPTNNNSIIYNEEHSGSSTDFYVNQEGETEFTDDSDQFNTDENSDEYNDAENSDDFIIIDESNEFNNANNISNNHNSVTSNTASKSNSTSSKTNNTTTSKINYSSSKPQTPASPSSKKPTTSVESNKNNSNVVYRTPKGERYHYSATCGGENSYKVSLKDALKSGLTPCKKCAE
ncbi:MAG: hypothetical protein IJA13_05170 [Clostridia bacterium]|nr:hypothetical protein [Clostridia bacterium]